MSSGSRRLVSLAHGGLVAASPRTAILVSVWVLVGILAPRSWAEREPVALRRDVRAIEATLKQIEEQTTSLRQLLAKQEDEIRRLRDIEARLESVHGLLVETRAATGALEAQEGSSRPYVIGFILGFIASVLSVLIFEWMRRPVLILGVTAPMPAAGGWRFVHVNVRNRRQIRGLRWLMPRLPSTLCRAWVRIYPPGGGDFTFDGRWTSQREPGRYLPGGAFEPDPGLILVPFREDIVAGETAVLVIAIKHQGDVECYGFNNESYLVPDRRLPDRFVGQGTSRVVVRVVSGDLVRLAEFELRNPSAALNDFELVDRPEARPMWQ